MPDIALRDVLGMCKMSVSLCLSRGSSCRRKELVTLIVLNQLRRACCMGSTVNLPEMSALPITCLVRHQSDFSSDSLLHVT